MNIAGIQKCSFVDYPGRLAAVFFVPGCNWNCFYCHNRAILRTELPKNCLQSADALELLRSRRGMLDGVVVTGGEPTLQAGLPSFIRDVRDLDFPVKLDTNGSRPRVLEALLEEGLLDYVAMDLKAPIAKYEAVCGIPVDHNAINESIDLIMASGIEYEFRTTVVPQLTHADVLAIARRIAGARQYVLQQFRKPAGADSDPRLDTAPHSSAWPAPILDELNQIVDHCESRGFQRATEAISAA